MNFLFNQILDTHLDNKKIAGLSEIQILLLDTKNAPLKINILDTIVKKYSGFARVEARSFLEKGKLSLVNKAPDQALEYFQKVVGNYPQQRSLAAEAAFLQSRVYALVGNREKLVQSFVQVVREFSDVPKWKKEAIKAILHLHEKQLTLEKKVSSLQALTQTYKDIPQLAAAIQNRIGALYHNANENLLAKEAYKTTAKTYKQDESFQARLALARIYAE